jgi:hypothetical protein
VALDGRGNDIIFSVKIIGIKKSNPEFVGGHSKSFRKGKGV